MQNRVRNAERLRNIRTSGIRRLFALDRHLPEVINLGIGEPDFSPPEHVIQAATQALKEGKTHYAPSRGIPELRQALSSKYAREYNLHYNPETEILITVGATEAVFLALLAFVNPGEEVLIPNPGFVCYAPATRIAGGLPVSIPMDADDGFRLDVKRVTSLITEKSRVIILNSPNNPTGCVFARAELEKLGTLAAENNLIVISDEVYEKIIYDNAKHFCLATSPGLQERTITINSCSKTYAMTGFRVGFALGPADLISSMLLVHQFVVASVSEPAQYAAVAALTGPQKSVVDMVAEFDKRRRLVHKRLNEIEGFRCSLPEGAFYVFPHIKEFGASSADLSEAIFKEAQVITTPGSAFGDSGEGFLRLSYATSYDQIAGAMERLEKVAGKFHRAKL